MTDTRFSTAAHILGYLAWRQREGQAWVSSQELGISINTHSVVVRRVISRLREHGLIETQRGPNGGSRLAKPAASIDLGEAYQAVMDHGATLISLGTPTDGAVCNVGPHIEAVLRDVLAESEDAFRRCLKRTTVEEFSKEVVKRVAESGLRPS